MDPNDDFELTEDARRMLARAQREGSGIIPVPYWMLAALIEKATRPHD